MNPTSASSTSVPPTVLLLPARTLPLATVVHAQPTVSVNLVTASPVFSASHLVIMSGMEQLLKGSILTGVSVALARSVLQRCASLMSAWLTAHQKAYSMMDVHAAAEHSALLDIALVECALHIAKVSNQ